MASETILFERRGPLGLITLNHPAILNALTLEMVQGLERHLRACAADPSISVIVLQGAGDKSFCAGGDVKTVVQESKQDPASTYARGFFETEYRVDYLIHVHPKPILVIGHGIVMGGGLGLMMGAACRVITESTQLAMPEISIGLYPDVGGTYFLSRLPGHLGLFLGLTAARINATDAVASGFADFTIQSSDRNDLVKELSRVSWDASPARNRTLLNQSLQKFADRVRTAPPAQVHPHEAEIEALVGKGQSLLEIAKNLRRKVTSTDPWIARGAQAFSQGCPMSAALIFEQWNRGKNLALADAFRLELDLSLNCVAGPNFYEGVRARLIDKDQSPHWQPATIEELETDPVLAYFKSPWTPEAHPFRDLESTD